MTDSPAPRDLIERLRADAQRLPGPSPALRPAVLAALDRGARGAATERPSAGPGRISLIAALAAAAALALLINRPWVPAAAGPASAAPTGAVATGAVATGAVATGAVATGAVTTGATPVEAAQHFVDLLATEPGRWTASVENPLRDEVRLLRERATTTGNFLARSIFHPLRALRLTPQLHDPQATSR